jgi:hypothetical protein
MKRVISLNKGEREMKEHENHKDHYVEMKAINLKSVQAVLNQNYNHAADIEYMINRLTDAREYELKLQDISERERGLK